MARSWSQVASWLRLSRHEEAWQTAEILACDFFTAGLLDGTQAHVPAVIEHATRRIRILGVTVHPTGEWTAQQARNLAMDLGEQAHRVKFMIRDRGCIQPLSSVWPAVAMLRQAPVVSLVGARVRFGSWPSDANWRAGGRVTPWRSSSTTLLTTYVTSGQDGRVGERP